MTGEHPVGTPGYSAPEQQADPQRADSRADIYSLGVVLYEMLTGERPGKRIEPPSRKVHIDVRLDEVVLRALEQEPGRRYQQASEVRTEVETIVATAPPGGGRHRAASSADQNRPAPTSGQIWSRRIFWAVASIIAMPVGLLAISVVAAQLSRQGIGTAGTVATVGVVAAIGLGLLLVVRALWRAFRTGAVDLANPWPRRIVGLLVAVALAPILLVVLSVVMVPLLSHVWSKARVGDPRPTITAGSDASTASFGPVIEREVPDMNQPGGTKALRFRTGELSAPPAENREAFRAWWVTNRMDLLVGRVDGQRSLLAAGLRLGDISSSRWEQATGLEVLESLLHKPSLAHPRDMELAENLFLLPDDLVLPFTMSFQTAEKDQGLLQIIGFTENPSAVKIRYKLVTSSAAVVPDSAHE